VTEVRRSPRKALKTEEITTPARKPKRQPAKQIKSENGEIKVEPPVGWEEMYSVTTELRKRHLAPVDTMGCESLAEDHRPPLERRLQTLVALMLSSQTKDTVTAVAMKNLQQNLPGGFTLSSLLAVDQEHLNQLISKVGFHNNKARFIKQTAAILQEKFAGDIPDTIEGLTSLPGVGPKMAYLTMSAAWGRDEGIGVDVHVHRITNLWGWHKTSTPEQTRAALEAWLPRDKWHDINHLLVGLGQTICLPVGRRCGECDLNARKLCPSAVAGSPAKRRVKQEIKVEVKQEADDDENTAPVKGVEIAYEADDVADVVKIKSEDLGEVETIETTNAGRVPDIEGLGAGRARRLAKAVSTL
jgi:endonuclease-3